MAQLFKTSNCKSHNAGSNRGGGRNINGAGNN
jgi:hypothetical protein